MPLPALPLAEFLTVWAFLAFNIATPGPNVLNTIASAIGSGRAAGLGSAVGVGLGIGVWCLGMSLGVAAVFARVPVVQTGMTALAVSLLIWFASRYLRAARTGWQAARQGAPRLVERKGQGFAAAFLRSLSINFANPKALTTWLAVVSIFPTARATGADIVLLCAGACALSFSIHSAYAVAFSTTAAARAYLRAAPAINAGVGVVFLAFALRLAVPLLP